MTDYHSIVLERGENMTQRNIVTGVSIEPDLLQELDKRRREIGMREGKDLPRSAYICQLLKIALKEENK